jgi:hypothetical protein
VGPRQRLHPRAEICLEFGNAGRRTGAQRYEPRGQAEQFLIR